MTTELIQTYHTKIRNLNKQLKELNVSITFFTNNQFPDIPHNYVTTLHAKKEYIILQLNEYHDLITGVKHLA